MKSSEVKLPLICLLTWLTPIPLLYVYFVPRVEVNDKRDGYFVENSTSKIIQIAEHCYIFIMPYLTTVISTLLMFLAYSKDKFRKQGSREGSERTYIIVKGNRSDNLDKKFCKKKVKQHEQFVKIVCLIVLGYSATCLPKMIVTLVKFYVPVNTDGYITLLILENFVALPLMLSNALVNVFVYIRMDKEFKKYVKGFFFKIFCLKFTILCGRNPTAEI